MARTLSKLSELAARTAKSPGRHSDGGGLYLHVGPSGSKSWVFMWTNGGRRREMGLGRYPAVPLAAARKRAAEHRAAIADGRDPLADKAKGAEPTFAKCADDFLAGRDKAWRNAKHRKQWSMTLKHYCAPIRDKKVSEISTHHVLMILKPIWQSRAETASRLRGRNRARPRLRQGTGLAYRREPCYLARASEERIASQAEAASPPCRDVLYGCARLHGKAAS